MTLPAGTRLAHFEILGSLGAGGMGEVYRAKDLKLGREIAIKVLPSSVSADRERLIRFAHEARAASALNHPNLVTIYEVGQIRSLPYIAMELVDGRTLRAMIAEGPLPFRRVLQIGCQIADGMAKAHDAGIVHRDLKPENVMVTSDGYVKILDFGLAKLIVPGDKGAEPGMTATGFVMGSPGYMAPEQAAGRAVDFRSDQFTIGLILYEMACGQRAFQRPTAIQTLSAIIQDDPEPLESRNPAIPAPFVWVVERCLAKEPAERYASTKDLARDLQIQRDRLNVAREPAAGAGEATHRIPASAPENRRTDPPRSSKKGAAGAVVALAAAAALAAGLAAGFWYKGYLAAPPPFRWTGDLLMGPSVPVFAPRAAPDSRTLGFLTRVDGVTQVAVMKPESGDWAVLTREASRGQVQHFSWSRDGTRLYYDRVEDRPVGIYSIPVLGGDERLVLEDAQSPEALSDGRLLFLRVAEDRNFRIARLDLESGRVTTIGPAILRESASAPSLQVFAGGREALLTGRLVSGGGNIRAAYIVNLRTGATRRFAPELPLAPPISVDADGSSVLASLETGDLHHLVRVPHAGNSLETLLTLPRRPAFVSAAPDRSLYLDFIDSPTEVLRIPTAGGEPERLAAAGRGVFMPPVELPDGRLLIAEGSAGRRRLLAVGPKSAPRPLLDTREQAGPPCALVGDGRIAFMGQVSPATPPEVSLASIADGRVIRRFDQTRGLAVASLAASADGNSLYLVQGGWIRRLDLASGKLERVCPGDGVAPERGGASLLVQINGREGASLSRLRLTDGSREMIPIAAGDFRLSTTPIAGNAAGPDGRVVVTVRSAAGINAGPAILDPATGSIARISVRFDGDIVPSSWGADGTVLGMGLGIRTELWRLRTVPSGR